MTDDLQPPPAVHNLHRMLEDLKGAIEEAVAHGYRLGVDEGLDSTWKLAEYRARIRREVAEEIAQAIEQSQSPLRVNPVADMVYVRAARTAREVGSA